MIKKLKSKAGAAFILAWIFFVLMLFLTGLAFEAIEDDASSVGSYVKKEYHYFIVKSGLNYYANLFNGLQYTETGTATVIDRLTDSGEDYTTGEFAFLENPSTDPDTTDDAKLTQFENYIKIDEFEEAFGNFQWLRSKVLDGSVTLSTLEEEYLEAHQVFEATFVLTGIPYYYDDNDLEMHTTLTFYGTQVAHDNFVSLNENTIRIKVDLIAPELTTLDENFNSVTNYDVKLGSQTISCVPEVVEDSSTGLDVYTWKSFS